MSSTLSKIKALAFKGLPIASIKFNNKLVNLFNFGEKSWNRSTDGLFEFQPIGETSTCSIKLRKRVFSPYIKELHIPSKLTDGNGNEYSVIKITDSGFSGAKIEKVTIPSSIKLIGKAAFQDCAKLATVEIEENSQLKYINSGCFAGCNKLSAINLQAATKLKDIGSRAFAGCTVLTVIELPQTITKIDAQAFYGCGTLCYMTVPSKVRLIGAEAFGGCTGLRAVYILGVPTIGNSAFSNCSAEATIYYNCTGALNKETSKPVYTTLGLTKETQIDTSFKLFKFMMDEDAHYQIEFNRDVSIPGLTTIAIPEKYQDERGSSSQITTVGTSAFENCATISKIIIPSSITSVKNYAFKGCTGLTEINLPDSITSIGSQAFYGCTALKSLEVSHKVTNIGTEAFANSNNLQVNLHSISTSDITLATSALAGCSANWLVSTKGEQNGLSYLKYKDNTIKITSGSICSGEVEIPETLDGCTVTAISSNVFADNGAITKVTIPNSVARLGAYAFKGCDALKEVILGDGLTCIEPYTFSGCSSLETLKFGSNITSIKEFAFGSNSTDVSKPTNIYIKNMTNWCEMTLGNAYSAPLNRSNSKVHYIYLNGNLVNSLSIPDDAVEVCNRAFYNCTDLTEVILGNSIFSIGIAAFDQCSKISKVTMNSNIAYIHTKAFSKCTEARTVEIPSLETWLNINMASDSGPIGQLEDQIYLEGNLITPDTIIEIPNTITTIKPGVLDYWQIKQLKIGKDVTFISKQALRFMYATEIIVTNDENSENTPIVYKSNDGVLYSGDGTTLIKYPVLKAQSGDYFDIPDAVKYIEDYAFYGCTNLMIISASEISSLVAIGTSAFEYCPDLIHVTIPDSVNIINERAFYGCKDLQSITMGAGLTSVGADVFVDCEALTEVSIRDLSNWCSISFAGFDSTPFGKATTLYIGENNEDIEGKLVIPNGVKAIKSYAFYNLDCITSVVIPDSVTSIGNYAFGDCSELQSLDTGDRDIDSITIAKNAFYNCPKLDEAVDTSPTCSAAGCNKTAAHKVGNRWLCDEHYEETLEDSEPEYELDEEEEEGSGSDLGPHITWSSLGVMSLAAGAICMVFVAQKIAVLALTIIGVVFLLAGLVMTVVGLAMLPHEKANSTAKDELNVTNAPLLACATAIAPEGFSQWNGSKVDLRGSSITSLGPRSFAKCPNLVEVYVTAGVTRIDSEAFSECPNLIIKCEAVSKPDTWDDNWNPDNRPVIWNCNKKFTPSNYFSYEPLGDGTVSIKAAVANLPSKIVLPSISPEGRIVSTIATNAFANCTNITHVIVPEGVTAIGNGAFSKCTNLFDINLPKSLTYIGNDAFYHCDSLYTISIPESVTSIASYAFRDCTSLSNVLIPKSVDELGYGAFLCKDNRELTIYCETSEIPDGWSPYWNITTILATNHFDVVWDCLAPMSDNYFSYTLQDDGTYAVSAIKTDGIHQTWPVLSIPARYENKDVTAIADSGFANCSSLSKIVIPNSIQSIGENAFQSCGNLTSITLPDNLTRLWSGAFMNCSDLRTIKIPDSVTTHYKSESLFSGCSSLMDVKLPQHWSKIGKSMFSGCTSLEVISLPASTGHIDTGAFSGCTSLHSVYLKYPKWSTSSGKKLDLSNSSATTIATYLVNDYVSDFLIATSYAAPIMNAVLKPHLDRLDLETTIENTNRQSCHLTVKMILLNNSTVVDTAELNTDSEAFILPGMGQAKFSTSINLPLKDKDNNVINFNEIELKAYFETGEEAKVFFALDHNLVYTLLRHTNDEYSIKAIDPSKISVQVLEIPSSFIFGRGTITALGDNAFKGAAITRVELPNSITSIGKNAFSNTWLEDIYIPLSVTHIGEDAFSGTPNMSAYCDVYSRPNTWAENWDTDIKDITWGHSCTGEHSYQKSETVVPTCENDGYTVHYCSRCNYPYYDNYVDALGHRYTSVVKTPTCTADGYTTHTCSICGDTYKTNYVEALGHLLLSGLPLLPTCTENGHRGGKRCKRCGYTTPMELLPALGHTYDEGIVITPATCKEDGLRRKTCQVCGHILEEAIPRLGGEHEYVCVDTPATCTEDGYSTYTCTKCGHSYIADPVAALGHISSDWIIDVRPTGATEGSKHKECTRCGEILETATIAKLENADEYLTYTLLDSGDGYSVKATYLDYLPNELAIPSTFNGKPVTIVEFEAFANYRQDYNVSVPLTKVILPSSIKAILGDAFCDCTNLTEINIPIGVEYIADSAFYECTNLTIYCEASSQPDTWDENWNYSNCNVVWGCGDTYLTTEDGNNLTDENENLLIL